MLKSCGTMDAINIFRKNSDTYIFTDRYRRSVRQRREANGSLQFGETVRILVVDYIVSILFWV